MSSCSSSLPTLILQKKNERRFVKVFVFVFVVARTCEFVVDEEKDEEKSVLVRFVHNHLRGKLL